MAYTGRFFGTIVGEAAWEAGGKDIMGAASPLASQADLSKKPTRVRTFMVARRGVDFYVASVVT